MPREVIFDFRLNIMSEQEIEIKLKLKDNKPLLEFLKEKGSFQYEKNQRDEYFTPAHRDFIKEKPVKEWLRLRKEENKYSLNYKNWHIEADGKSYHCDEYEVKLDDIGKTKKIFKALDFKPLIVVNKKRKVFVFKDYEIALDEVDELGDYIEVEYIARESGVSAKEVADKMKKFIEKTGCQILEQDFKGYPFLLLKKKYKKF